MMILNWRYKFMTFLKFYDNGEEVLLNANAIDKIIINEVEARTNGGSPSTAYIGRGVFIWKIMFEKTGKSGLFPNIKKFV